MLYRVALMAVSGVILVCLPCLYAQPTQSAESAPLERPGNFYGIAGDDVIGMGLGYLAEGTYLGLEWYAKDTSQHGHCDKSEQSFTVALTPGLVQFRDNRRYVVNAILGYYQADYIDYCAYPEENDDSGFDYGLGLTMSVMVKPRFGYMLGVRYTDIGGVGFTFGISW